MSGSRLAEGGSAIDRSRPLRFTFDGRAHTGFAGDTLASALLAAGVSVVGRSFKYHRPRGLLAAGVEEPNALVRLEDGPRTDVNLRATEIELYDGLAAAPVNCWPSARFDVGAINAAISRFIPAGFYYKPFMWPDWRWFEPPIRRAAGLGRISTSPDPDRYDERHAHCDLRVVGGGPAGLAAALAASRRGERVVLAEQDPALGGAALWRAATIDGLEGAAWVARAQAELDAAPETTALVRATAIGCFDHNSVAVLERLVDRRDRDARRPRLRLWRVRARRIVLATGAIERPLVFPGNDRPGVMLASAVQQNLERWAALAGEAAVIFTDNDSAYAAAHALVGAGAQVVALLDRRPAPPKPLVEAAEARGVRVLPGTEVTATHGAPALSAVTARTRDGATFKLQADLLAMSGGWNPAVHLFSQTGGALAWDAAQALFKPSAMVRGYDVVGAADARFDLGGALEQGWRAGGGHGAPPAASGEARPWTFSAIGRVAAPGKAFLDFQNDVTVDDLALARRESFVSVEHLKRYTTLGMAPDQGKTSNVNALALMAELTGRGVAQTGTTRFRPPYTPAAFGAFGGRMRGELFRPRRRLPAHDRHIEAGAVFEEYGGWLRPACYAHAGATPSEAVREEALAVRRGVGLFDASPLGKIEVAGPDAAEFLDRVYANTMSTLKVGRARYGLMLNELGVVIDDGVTARLAEDRFLVGATGAGAARIAAWLEEWLQCEWPHLDVLVAPVTTSLAVLTLSGPKARAVLEAAGVDIPVDAAAFPHMAFRDGRVAGTPARIFRVSFTGEVSYEINVAADRAGELWDRLLAAGRPHGVRPVGIDAWMLLRTEKGYLHVGADTDGGTAPGDVGWGHVLKRTHDFIGRRSLTRPANLREDRLQFVGLEVVGSSAPLTIGGHLKGAGGDEPSDGYVTSSGFSPVLGRGVALGMVRGGRDRLGEELMVASGPERGARVRVTAPGAYDPTGERLNG